MFPSAHSSDDRRASHPGPGAEVPHHLLRHGLDHVHTPVALGDYHIAQFLGPPPRTTVPVLTGTLRHGQAGAGPSTGVMPLG